MSKILYFIYQFSYILHQNNIPLLPSLINKIFIRLMLGCHIGLGAKIGKGTILGYGGLGTVIHHRSVIGENVLIHTGVTLGGTSKKYEVPVIGDNCIISSGAKVIGPVKIGKNCIVGANAVVLTDIPDNSIVVGIPAKIIKRDINIFDYRN